MAIPFIGQTLEELRQRQLAYERAKLQLAQQETGIWHQYGVTGTYADGKMTGMQADPNNPHGAYWNLMRGHADELEALEEEQRGRGFKGGLLGQETERARFMQGGEQQNLMQALMEGLGGVAHAKAENEYGYQADRTNIWKNALAQAMANGDFTPVTDPGAPTRSGRNRRRRPQMVVRRVWVPNRGWVRRRVREGS